MLAELRTPDCIWNSFRSSGKKHLILTGGRRTGKTTLLSRLFPEGAAGVTTWAVPGECVFLKENETERTVWVGTFDGTAKGEENKMRPCPEGFLGLGVSALRSCMGSEDEWITVDEIGYLETECPAYCEALLELMEKKRVAAVVRKQSLPFLQSLCARADAFLIDLDEPFGNLGCVIMASGLGKRFGGNKLMADFDGKPMIERALRATDGIFSARAVVTRSADVAAYCEKRGVRVILHGLPNRNDTVRLGLLAMEETEGCLFCPGDQPLLSRETVAALALAARNDKDGIIRPACGETEGAPVLFPKSVYGELLHLPEGKGGGAVIRKHPDLLRKIRVADPHELMDADTPEQLAFLLGRIGSFPQ